MAWYRTASVERVDFFHMAVSKKKAVDGIQYSKQISKTRRTYDVNAFSNRTSGPIRQTVSQSLQLLICYFIGRGRGEGRRWQFCGQLKHETFMRKFLGENIWLPSPFVSKLCFNTHVLKKQKRDKKKEKREKRKKKKEWLWRMIVVKIRDIIHFSILLLNHLGNLIFAFSLSKPHTIFPFFLYFFFISAGVSAIPAPKLHTTQRSPFPRLGLAQNNFFFQCKVLSWLLLKLRTPWMIHLLSIEGVFFLGLKSNGTKPTTFLSFFLFFFFLMEEGERESGGKFYPMVLCLSTSRFKFFIFAFDQRWWGWQTKKRWGVIFMLGHDVFFFSFPFLFFWRGEGVLVVGEEDRVPESFHGVGVAQFGWLFRHLLSWDPDGVCLIIMFTWTMNEK